jgi:uncharacterized protein
MIYELTVSQFTKMLHNVNAILDKSIQFAETKKFDSSVLVESRLAPDQFNLARQIQILCDTAKKCASQLTGKDAPVQADNEKTMAELKSRVTSVISYLGTFTAKDFTDAGSKLITQPRWEGQHLTGSEFVIHHAVPNFYFHVSTAYAILRHNGVDIGKRDYLGTMPYRK